MSGYSGTPLWKKLGYKDGLVAYLDGSYDNYIENLQLPADIRVTWTTRAKAGIHFIHLFATTRRTLETKLPSYRRILDPNGVLWVSRPKKSSRVATDVTENSVREIALPLGLTDIKVCAVNEVWSGLKLMIRKELR